jgi:kynurenine 3-monooxygenase
MNKTPQNIAIVGCGLVGSLLSCYLAKKGFKVDVYERRPDMRIGNTEGGRSINLAMSVRGWTALEKIGMKSKLEPIAIPMYGRLIHNTDGSEVFQPYGKEGQAIYSISRGDLNRILMEEADTYSNISLHFNEKCANVDFKTNTITFENTESGKNHSVNPDLIFGTDGAFSEVRYAMQKTPFFNFSQQYIEHGYKELCIPPDANGNHRIEKNALHIWPRKSFMLIALPNMDGSFTVTLFAPFKGENSFDSIQSDTDIVAYFEKHFPSALKHMPDLIKDYHENPTSGLVTTRAYPWHYKNACLLGDAAHAVVPFYGQGMNAGFEDCRILDRLIDEKGMENWLEIFEKYSELRAPDGNAIADLALRNFIEMRDSTANPQFLLRKKMEQFLMEKYPKRFVPQYSMVTFSDIRYSFALRKGDEQVAMLESLLNKYPDPESWANSEISNTVEAWLNANEPVYT